MYAEVWMVLCFLALHLQNKTNIYRLFIYLASAFTYLHMEVHALCALKMQTSCIMANTCTS